MSGAKGLFLRRMQVAEMEINLNRAMDNEVIEKPEQGPIEDAMDRFQYGKIEDINPREFFIAWQIPAPIIAERLRRAGFKTTLSEINSILRDGIKDKHNAYLLSVCMMEIRNDITKTLYPISQ